MNTDDDDFAPTVHTIPSYLCLSLLICVHPCPLFLCETDNSVYPLNEGVEELAADVGILAAGAGRDVEGVVGVLKQRQGGARAEAVDERPEQREIGERVVRALQKQHRDLRVEEVLGALVRRTAGGM